MINFTQAFDHFYFICLFIYSGFFSSSSLRTSFQNVFNVGLCLAKHLRPVYT